MYVCNVINHKICFTSVWLSNYVLAEAQLKSALIYFHNRPADVIEIFGEIYPPDLNDMFDVKKPRFDKRTSSANWDLPLYCPYDMSFHHVDSVHYWQSSSVQTGAWNCCIYYYVRPSRCKQQDIRLTSDLTSVLSQARCGWDCNAVKMEPFFLVCSSCYLLKRDNKVAMREDCELFVWHHPKDCLQSEALSSTLFNVELQSSCDQNVRFLIFVYVRLSVYFNDLHWPLRKQ